MVCTDRNSSADWEVCSRKLINHIEKRRCYREYIRTLIGNSVLHMEVGNGWGNLEKPR